jgi:hypothetical protein
MVILRSKTRAIGYSNLKNGLCEIDSNGRILHGGFLLILLLVDQMMTLLLQVTRKSP